MTPPEVEGWKPPPRGYNLPTLGPRYLELETAKDWGLTPWKFDALENDEKAEMMAFMWVYRLVENYHYEKGQQAAKSNAQRETAAQNKPRRFR